MERNGNVTICNENNNESDEIIHVDLAGMNINQSTKLFLCSENVKNVKRESVLNDSLLAILTSMIHFLKNELEEEKVIYKNVISKR